MNEVSNFCDGQCPSPTSTATTAQVVTSLGERPAHDDSVLPSDIHFASAEPSGDTSSAPQYLGRSKTKVPVVEARLSNGDDLKASSLDGHSHVADISPPRLTPSMSLPSSFLSSPSYSHPPYAIRNCGGLVGCPLDHHTISADALHFPFQTRNAPSGTTAIEYNLHSLFGLSEAIATNRALSLASDSEKRPFVLSRSTFPGSGAHTAHWTGDNASSWPDMQYAITTILSMNLFGIMMVGADICGFTGNTTEELCARWIQLGSFSSFCRNHNQIKMRPQELYVWPSVAKISNTVLSNRYRLAPYWFTLLADASTTGATVTRPLFWHFPNDTVALGIDAQFMVGEALLVTPVLQEGKTSVTGYFPDAIW